MMLTWEKDLIHITLFKLYYLKEKRKIYTFNVRVKVLNIFSHVKFLITRLTHSSLDLLILGL